MIFVGILILSVSFYISMVIGSYNKLVLNGIYLKGKAKMFFIIVPFAIFVLHFVWSLKSLKTDPKVSLRILKFVVLKYPIVLGLMIEVFLEKAAFDLSQQDEIVRIQKRKSLRKAVRKSKALNLSDMEPKNTRTILKEYKNTVYAAALVAN